MAALAVEEIIKQIELRLESLKEKIRTIGNSKAEADLDHLTKLLAELGRKSTQKGRAGFYAGRTR